MFKAFLIGWLFCLIMFVEGFSQPSTQSTISNYTYHPLSADKVSWQRLNLLLTNDYYRGVKFSKIGSDSSMIYISKVLGISRLVVTAEGIDDPELIGQSNWFDERNPGKGIQLLSQAKGKKHLELMILLGAYYTFQPGSYKHYRDSVEYFLKTSLTESKTINEGRLGRVALCLLIKMYGIGADTANANAVFTQLINECHEAGDRITEARAFVYRGIYTAYKPYNLQGKIDDLQKAMEISHELKDTEREIYVLSNVAFMYMIQNKFDDAHTAFVKAVELERSIGYPYTQYSTDHIVMLTMLQDKFGEPLKYTLESIKVAESTRVSIGCAEFYLRLGQLYYMEGGRNEESLKWMFKALDSYVAANDGNVYSTLFNVVSLMIENGGSEKEALDLVLRISKKSPPLDIDEQLLYHLSIATCYIGLKQYPLAEQHIGAADSIHKIAPPISIAGSYQKKAISDLLSSVNFARGEYRKVKEYLENSLADSSRASILSEDLHAYQRLIYIDSVFDDAASGVKHYKQYATLLDSNFRVSKIRQAEELQVAYQTDEQKKRIALLDQQTQLEQANLKQAKLVNNLTIAGIIAVLIIAALLYRQSRLRKKNNKMITHKNELLEHLLTEKEWLLKEIHHRVKNNFHTVMGLLGTQSGYLKNEIAVKAIADSRHRIQAMSLIHQKLYQTNNLSAINMPDYIHELVDYLRDSFDTGSRISFNMQIERIELDLAHCIPLGLIMNEAITNSIKYAFPGNREGSIFISFRNTSDDHFLLSISDNGVGLPVGFNGRASDSMGMNLMRGLSEEIGAEFTIGSQNGTQIAISFVYDHDVTTGITLIETEPAHSI